MRDSIFEQGLAILHSPLYASGKTIITLGTLIYLCLFTLLLFVVTGKLKCWIVERLLASSRVDIGVRHAVGTIVRYVAVTVGLIVILETAGIDLSTLTVLAGALGIGIGFGLQNITNNLVSGIILLFERPFRVGDIITVGDLSGRVTRIRTRATTVLDFDNKEIVIPNKTFITGQLINWTLTDTITRVVIRVGVAYNTDTDKVRALLLQAAKEDQRVLAEPEPVCWFLTFGASSLDFELRVYVNTISHRLEVQDFLNNRIKALFAEHHIEIAFPQLDLHVRDLPAAINGAAKTEKV